MVGEKGPGPQKSLFMVGEKTLGLQSRCSWRAKNLWPCKSQFVVGEKLLTLESRCPWWAKNSWALDETKKHSCPEHRSAMKLMGRSIALQSGRHVQKMRQKPLGPRMVVSKATRPPTGIDGL